MENPTVTEPGSVLVEFFGIPRDRARCAELAVPAGSLGEILAEVEQRCPRLTGLFLAGRLAPQYLFSLDGQQFLTDPRVPLEPGCRLLILSADVGG